MKFSVLTLFPEQVKRFLGESIIGRAEEKGILQIEAVDIRDFSGNRYGKVDDTLFGGGTGMLMQCEPVFQAFSSLYDAKTEKKPHCIFMSPKGSVLTQNKAKELARYDHIVILCGLNVDAACRDTALRVVRHHKGVAAGRKSAYSYVGARIEHFNGFPVVLSVFHRLHTERCDTAADGQNGVPCGGLRTDGGVVSGGVD